MTFSRRHILQSVSAGVALAALQRLGASSAHAGTSNDYKALVCLFLAGGYDGHSMFIPVGGKTGAAYRDIRKRLPPQTGEAQRVSTRDGAAYMLHGGYAALAPLWTQRKLAVLANVGNLQQPVTRDQFLNKSVPVPLNLFSHPDQILQMQTADPAGGMSSGWAGRASDAVKSLNGGAAFPAAFSMNGAALFGQGRDVQSVSLYPGFDLTLNGLGAWPATAQTARLAALQEIINLDSGVMTIRAADMVRQDALALNKMLSAAGQGATLKTTFPATYIGKQLAHVASLMSLREKVGIKRQVFFCSIGGFDTHADQSWTYWDLLKQAGDAMAAFYAATVELGIAENVTTFTESDFGRTLDPNDTGTDHGWGNHHIILGGAVKGGDVYGTFPTLELGGPDDSSLRGALIPSTALDQYGATLAKWFGVDAANMRTVFPNLKSFEKTDLGFMA